MEAAQGKLNPQAVFFPFTSSSGLSSPSSFLPLPSWGLPSLTGLMRMGGGTLAPRCHKLHSKRDFGNNTAHALGDSTMFLSCLTSGSCPNPTG